MKVIILDTAEEFSESMKTAIGADLLATGQVKSIPIKKEGLRLTKKKVKTKREAAKQVVKAESTFKANLAGRITWDEENV